MMNFDIGGKIKTLRLAKSMTQEQLARALHVSAQAVRKWENGATMPDIQLLPELSVLLGTSIDALFSLTDGSRFARIENMIEDKRFLTPQEFGAEERFLQDKCGDEEDAPRAALLLAQLYCKRAREYQELAAPIARRALELAPGCKQAHNAIFDAEGGTYLDWNVVNRRGTIAFYKDFVAAHPEEYSAYLWLLDLLLADGRCAEARQYLARLHRLRPGYNDELYLGIICKKEGNLPEALAHWDKMCADYGELWQAWVTRASELAKLCRYDEAMADYEKALSLMPRPRFVDPEEAMAQICEIRGDYAGAIAHYERLLDIMRTDWDQTQGEAVDAPRREIERLRDLQNA